MSTTETNEPSAADLQHWRMLRRIWIGAVSWALIGAVIAWRAMGDVNADAKRWVGVASTVAPLCAVAAALFIRRRRNLGVAGGLLFLSMIAMPTYFAWPVNILPTVLIVALAITVRKSGQSQHRVRGLGR